VLKGIGINTLSKIEADTRRRCEMQVHVYCVGFKVTGTINGPGDRETKTEFMMMRFTSPLTRDTDLATVLTIGIERFGKPRIFKSHSFPPHVEMESISYLGCHEINAFLG
jgi:hypothetical protein